MAAVVPGKDNQLRVVEVAASILDALVCGKAGEAIGRGAKVDTGTAKKSTAVADGCVVEALEALRYGSIELVVYLGGESAC